MLPPKKIFPLELDVDPSENTSLTDTQKAGLAGTLRDRLESLETLHEFNEGDLVEWKPGLQNRKSDGPFIIVQILDEPVFDSETESGSAYFRSRLDVVVGLILEGKFLTYHHELNRLQPYTGPLPETLTAAHS